MKLLHLTKIATLASLLALSNISCAADPVKPSISAPRPDATNNSTATSYQPHGTVPSGFKLSRDGYFTPINKSGKEFAPCSQNGKGTCEINNKPVIINEMRTTVITEIVHTGSPTCLLICVQPRNRPERCSYDIDIPECAALNK